MTSPDRPPRPGLPGLSGRLGLGALGALVVLLAGCSGPPPAEEPTGEAAEEALTVAVADDPLDRTVARIYALAMTSRDLPAVVEVGDAAPGDLVEGFAADDGATSPPADGAGMVVAHARDLARELDPPGYRELIGGESAPAPTADELLDLVEEAVEDAEVLAPAAAVLDESMVITSITAVEQDIPRDAEEAAGPAPAVAEACDGLAVGVPEGLPDAEERLARLHDCEPAALRTGTEDELIRRLITAELDAVVVGSAHPGIAQHDLVALADDERAFPRDQLVPVADEAVAGDLPDVVAEVSGRLDEDALVTLRRLLDGEQGLDPAEAAEYWLVEEELIAAPEDWG